MIRLWRGLDPSDLQLRSLSRVCQRIGAWEHFPSGLLLIEDVHAVQAGQCDRALDLVFEENKVGHLATRLNPQHSIEVEEADVGATLETVEVDVVRLVGVAALTHHDCEHSRAELRDDRALQKLLGAARRDELSLEAATPRNLDQVKLCSWLLLGTSV